MALGIVNILGKSKETETIDLIKKHMEAITETKKSFSEAYSAFKEGKMNVVELKTNETSEREKDADRICKNIVLNLYEGAFLPNLRSNIYRTVDEMDSVADKIKNACNMLTYLKVAKLNKALNSILDELFDCVTKTVDTLGLVVDSFIKDDDAGFKKNAEVVKKLEEEADRAQKLMYDELIFGKHDPKTIHVVSAFGHFMANVTDAADNSCDTMELLKITHG